jgi:hypothetical protein
LILKKAVEILKESSVSSHIFYAAGFMENFSVASYKQGKRINLAGLI